MIHRPWVSECRKNLVCVDSYENGVLQGRISNPYGCIETFSSLSQFLVRMEQMLEDTQQPQAFNTPRKFAMTMPPEDAASYASFRNGMLGTFELKIIFRQNTSWQGILVWRDKKMENSFRSVLELVILLDSALRIEERSGCA